MRLLTEAVKNDPAPPVGGRDVALHHSGRTVASNAGGSIRYRLPLPINLEGEILLVVSMLARPPKDKDALEDQHATIGVGGGTANRESMDPGALHEALQAWITPGAAPENQVVRLRLARVSMDLDGVDQSAVAWAVTKFGEARVLSAPKANGHTEAFFGSLFVEIRQVHKQSPPAGMI